MGPPQVTRAESEDMDMSALSKCTLGGVQVIKYIYSTILQIIILLFNFQYIQYNKPYF